MNNSEEKTTVATEEKTLSLEEISAVIALFSATSVGVAHFFSFYPRQFGNLYDQLIMVKGIPSSEEYLYSLIFCLFVLLSASVLCLTMPPLVRIVGNIITSTSQVKLFFPNNYTALKNSTNKSTRLFVFLKVFLKKKETQIILYTLSVVLFACTASLYPLTITIFLSICTLIILSIKTISEKIRIVLGTFMFIVSLLIYFLDSINDTGKDYDLTVHTQIEGFHTINQDKILHIFGDRLIVKGEQENLKSIPLSSITVIDINKKLPKE